MSETRSLTIRHTPADGTTLEGDPRPHHPILKTAGWRWARSGFWYVPRSRDAGANVAAVERVAEELRGAGFVVAVELEDGRRSVAEIEADRAERAAERAERLEAAAAKRAARSDDLAERSRQMADAIPFGQPILVDHYSAGRDRRYRDRIHSTMGRAVEAGREAEDLERRAHAAEATQSHREAIGTTLRRLKRLEAEARKIRRTLTPCTGSGQSQETHAYQWPESPALSCRNCHQHVTIVGGILADHGHATGAYAERLTARLAVLAEEVDYWRVHVAEREAAGGGKVWGPDDFAKGDRVNDSATVVAVNKKSLRVVHDVWREQGFSHLLPYHKVRSRTPAPVAVS